MKFSPQQSQALDAVSRWMKSRDKPWFYLAGYAGTGKTSLAKHFAAGVRRGVLYGAYTGKAAMVMRKNDCFGASTIHSMIYDFDQSRRTGELKFRLKAKDDFSYVDLIIIDECSMVDEELAKHLLSFGIPVLVLGDPGQLPPVGGAGFFTSNEPDFMLTEVHRQADESPIIRLATDAREGRRLEIGQYGESKVVSRYDIEQADVIDADQVLVGTNKKRSMYNRRLREIHGFKSEFPEVGDQLVCLRNDSTLGLFNGSLWEVIRLKPRPRGALNDSLLSFVVKSLDFDGTQPVEVRVREEFFNGDPKEIPWKEKRGTQEFDFGYALTVHKSQGSQWGSVCLFDESATFAADHGRHLYTGLTRAAEKITVVI
jgi:exodeoxyribonuclease-5